ncbi:MAG: VOC family protein [Oscillospiraceae bacterium]|nr:VOC family protein [Oscillospiraceae bacterium]
MKFQFCHNNINVLDLEKSIKFYKDALGFEEVERKEASDGSFIIVFLSDGVTGRSLELTWLRDKKEAYNLGDNEIHMAVRTADVDAAFRHHSEMGCVVYVNEAMKLYFIADPDGYWTEILPLKK